MRPFFTVLLCCTTSLAQAQLFFDAEKIIATAGVYCEIGSVGKSEAPGTDVGEIDLLEYTPSFQWDTMVVPAQLGLSFGVRSEALGGEVYENVIIRLSHPAFAETGTTEQVYVSTLDSLNINAYSFDLTRELAQGPWILQAEWNGQVLYKAEFMVVDPAQLPQIANGCAKGMMS